MLTTGTIADAVAGGRRRHFNFEGDKFRGYIDYMFGSATDGVLAEQAFLVHQSPGWVLPVHFHMQFQMQVVVGGSGTLGKHALGPGSVHYATPQSAYGPLIAGPQGLEYFTLRVRADRGAWYMPESRPMMEPGKRRDQATGDRPPGEGLPATTVIPLRTDGAGAWIYCADAGVKVSCTVPATPSGRFHIVLHGSFAVAGQVLPRHGCMFWSPPDAQPEFESVEDRSELVVVQFPEAALHNHLPREIMMNAPVLTPD